jgi:hypothetical protein
MVGEDDGDLPGAAIAQGETPAKEGVVHVYHIHGLEQLPGGGLISQREIKARICQRHARASDDAGFVIPIIHIAECEDIYFMPHDLKGAFIQVNVIRDAADIRLVGICHHSDSHGLMLRQARKSVKE